MYDWKSTSEWGFAKELEALKIMAHKLPKINVRPRGGLNEADGWCDLGGIEVKSYASAYRRPSIETKCILPYFKKSCWLSDDEFKILAVYHVDDIHFYNIDKLKHHYYETENLLEYSCPVSQGDGTYKTMKFIDIGQISSSNERVLLDDDRLRWDCSKLKTLNPYMGTIKVTPELLSLI